MNIIKKFLPLGISIITISLSFNAISYIPSAKTVLSRTIKRHGAGIYRIEQEVTFPTGATDSNHFILREKWIIENENSMHLTVTGTRNHKGTIFFERLYKNGVRYSYDPTGKITSYKIPEGFTEKFFHYRSLENFARELKKQTILPSSFFISSYHPKELSEISYTHEPFTRLARVGGVVTYSYGTASTQARLLPGIWIEQDQFVLRKLRLKSGLELTSSHYSQYTKNLYFPKKRQIQWQDRQYRIQLISLKHRNFSKTLKAKLSTKGLTKIYKLHGLQDVPNKDVVMDFYQRFR